MKTVIFDTIHGSHLYGLATGSSDLDVYRVFEGTGTQLKQGVHGSLDLVRGDLEAFVIRAQSGSHQSLEALFSPVKQWGPGMESKWGPYLAGFRVTGSEVFEKYERTIKKFCYGDFKRRRHACRLAFNLGELRHSGRFNPRMKAEEDAGGGRPAWCSPRREGLVLMDASIFVIIITVVTWPLFLWVMSHLDTRLSEAQTRIDPKVKAEIDVTPEWWDAEFRKLNGEPKPTRPRNAPKGSAGGSGAALLASQPEHTDDHEIMEVRSFADRYVLRYCVDCREDI